MDIHDVISSLSWHNTTMGQIKIWSWFPFVQWHEPQRDVIHHYKVELHPAPSQDSPHLTYSLCQAGLDGPQWYHLPSY